MNQNYFVGTGTLLRLFLRRDRFLLPIWVFMPMLLLWSQASFVTALPDWQEFLAELTTNPLAGAMLGPVVPLTTAGAVIWRGFVQGSLVVIIGSLLTVIRHTRTEEEAGRSELIRGGVVGRHAILTAALVLTCVANLVAGLLAALALIANGFSVDGSLLFGFTITATGCFFTGIGALCAQFREHAGSAKSIAFAILGLGMLLLIWNNVGGGYTGWAWLAPQAWYRLTKPFAGNDRGALLALFILSAIPMIGAYVLSIHRDLGAGLFQQRLGPSAGAPSLRSPLTLAWKLHRGTMMGWTIGMVFIGAAIGTVIPSISESIGDMLSNMWVDVWVEMIEKIGNREAFMAVAIYILSLMTGVTIYGIATVLRLRKEERENLAEPLLARPVSRMGWMSSHLILGFIGSAFLQLVLGLAAGLGWGLTIGDVSGVLPRVLGMSISKIPIVWVMVGIAAMLYGLLPRAASVLSWSLVVLFVVIEMLWEAQVVDWSVMRFSPFSYAHYTIPISELPILPLLGLICLAAALTGIGLMGFKRRSIG